MERKYRSKLVSPEGATLVGAAGENFEIRFSTLLQMTFTTFFLRKKSFDYKWNLYVSSLTLTSDANNDRWPVKTGEKMKISL